MARSARTSSTSCCSHPRWPYPFWGSAMNWAAALVGLSLTALLAASLPGKLHPAATDEWRERDRAEAAAAERLDARGFRFTATQALSVDGLYRTLSFGNPDCVGPLRLVAVPINGEAAAMLRAILGPEEGVFYHYGGRAWPEIPVVRAYLTETALKMLRALGCSACAPSPLLPALMGSASCLAMAQR